MRRTAARSAVECAGEEELGSTELEGLTGHREGTRAGFCAHSSHHHVAAQSEVQGVGSQEVGDRRSAGEISICPGEEMTCWTKVSL